MPAAAGSTPTPVGGSGLCCDPRCGRGYECSGFHLPLVSLPSPFMCRLNAEGGLQSAWCVADVAVDPRMFLMPLPGLFWVLGHVPVGKLWNKRPH